MQVADRSHVLNMLDPRALHAVIEAESPHLIIPEIEAIATDALIDLEKNGFRVVPTALATKLTMDRKGIRELASKVGLKTSKYAFAETFKAYLDAVDVVGFPFVVKPVMSSSGKVRVSFIKREVESSWGMPKAEDEPRY